MSELELNANTIQPTRHRRSFLRKIIRGGFWYADEANHDYQYVIDNSCLQAICGISDINVLIKQQSIIQ